LFPRVDVHAEIECDISARVCPRAQRLVQALQVTVIITVETNVRQHRRLFPMSGIFFSMLFL
jgi:hypothetical protein